MFEKPGRSDTGIDCPHCGAVRDPEDLENLNDDEDLLSMYFCEACENIFYYNPEEGESYYDSPTE